MSSYNESIANLKARTRANTAFQQQQNTASAAAEGQRGISEAKDIAGKLSGFSETLGEWKQKDIIEKQEEGKIKARKAAAENAQKIAELNEELLRTKKEDTRYQEIKAEMLRLGGEDAYPDADRIAGLSPWQQVGYAKEKLRVFNESFPDKLAHSMQNSEKAMTIQGITFTPKELRENNIQGLPFKEAAVNVLTEDIRKASGVDKFSPELLKLAKTEDSIQKAKDGQMAKFRERYNIESSSNTRSKALKEWSNSPKDADDFHRMILINSNTVDKNNKLLGNSGGLDLAFSQLKKEGIANNSTAIADKYGGMELPEQLRIRLGAKKGTTFEQQWPGRFSELRSGIKAGYAAAVDAELKFQKADGKKLEAGFIQAGKKAAQEGRTLTTEEVNDWKRKFTDAGVPVPTGVTKYETATMQDQRESEQLLESLFASQNGRLTRDQLNAAHPLAAAQYWDKLEKWEAADLKNFGAPDKIKGHLNTVWTGMGLKANEKSPAYIEAFENAKADYARQYYNYIGMGHSAELASYWALRGKPGEAKDADGEPIPGAMGVLTEIEQNGANNKYVRIGQNIENQIEPGNIRVANIKLGKDQMKNNPEIINNGVIGGYYGRQQLDSIKANIDKHGTWAGLRKDKGARQYYEGLARGRSHDWMGLVDAQLKADGHPGLWPNGRPTLVNFFRGKDDNEQAVVAPEVRPLVNSVEVAGRYPSPTSYIYQRGLLKDGQHFGSGFSYWDNPDELAPGVF